MGRKNYPRRESRKQRRDHEALANYDRRANLIAISEGTQNRDPRRNRQPKSKFRFSSPAEIDKIAHEIFGGLYYSCKTETQAEG